MKRETKKAPEMTPEKIAQKEKRKLRIRQITAYTDFAVQIAGQLEVITFAVLIFIFRKRLATEDFRFIPVMKTVMVITLTALILTMAIVGIFIFFKFIKRNKMYRDRSAFTNIFYYFMALSVPMICWGIWETYEYSIDALTILWILQFLVVFNTFLKDKYLLQFIKREKKEAAKKEPANKPDGNSSAS